MIANSNNNRSLPAASLHGINDCRASLFIASRMRHLGPRQEGSQGPPDVWQLPGEVMAWRVSGCAGLGRCTSHIEPSSTLPVPHQDEVVVKPGDTAPVPAERQAAANKPIPADEKV